MKQENNKIRASIVICTYNGEKIIEKCIQSLLVQDYPKDAYEIILVDDGSTDNTFEVASKFPIRVIRHKKNLGLANARNTGLEHAKGDIYICFDDDCFADAEWLGELLDVYSQDIAGVCGYTQNSTKGIIDRYLAEIGHGNPSPIIKSDIKNPMQRFIFYLRNMYSKVTKKKYPAKFKVAEIWGENCSFPTNLLKKVNGWDEKLSGIEDTDICNRIMQVTDKHFMCTQKARIYHNGKVSLFQLLQKQYTRGYPTLRYYRQNNKIPPIFPLPFIVIATSLASIVLFGKEGLIAFIVAPLLAYGWWIMKLVKSKNLFYITFPFIQFVMELASLLGMASGYIKMLQKNLKENKK